MQMLHEIRASLARCPWSLATLELLVDCRPLAADRNSGAPKIFREGEEDGAEDREIRESRRDRLELTYL